MMLPKDIEKVLILNTNGEIDVRNTAIELAKRMLVDSIWKAANVEGLGTTFPNTCAILDNAPVMTTREEVFFIVNMKRAWQFLFDNIDYPTNIAFAKELNKITGEGLFSRNGEIRVTPISIGGTNWAPEIPNSAVVAENIKNLSAIEDPRVRAAELFCYMARTQAFPDGNKRVAQLLANKALIESNTGILSIPLEKDSEFYDKLIRFYETGDNRDMKSFLIEDCMTLIPDIAKSADYVVDPIDESEFILR